MISAIILAAGSSVRMGAPKLLLPFNGMPLVENIINIVKKSALFDEIVLVYRDAEVKNIAEDCGLKAVYNSDAQLGLSTSLKKGIQSCSSESDSFMFFTGDQPFINKELIGKLIDKHSKNKGKIIVPLYNGKRGMPTIFPAVWHKSLMELEGDTGGRVIIQDNPEQVLFVNIEEENMSIDIDNSEDYMKALNIKE
ncbi:MAG: nucleotidyltransferase family protein [Caulobacteraceae bacterium]